MSETTFPGIIKDTEIQDNGVASLRTAPNRGGTWGQNGLTAGDLQKKFDALPTLIAQRLNALITSIEKGDTPESEARREAIALLNKALAEEITARATEDAKKLDTPNNTTGGNKVLVSRWNSAISLWGMQSAPADAGALAMFTDRKTLMTGTATDDKDAVPLKQMQDAISKAIADLVNGAPEALNTLAELAAALKGNPDVVATLESAIADKASKKELADEKTAREQALAGKLDKLPPMGGGAVYGIDPSGENRLRPFSWTPIAHHLTQYSLAGTLKTNTATDGKDAVPLAQMEEALEEKADTAALDTLAKKVENLEAGVAPDMFTVDDATAYVKPIPADAAPYAELRSVGGMIHAHELPAPNLFADSVLAQESGKEYDDGYGNGCTFYRDAEGKYSVYPLIEYPLSQSYYTEHTFGEIFPSAEVGKKYIFSYDVSEPWDEYWSSGSIYIPSVFVGVSFTMTEAILNSRIDFHCASHYDGTMERAQTETFSNISLREEANVRYLTEAKVTSLDIYGKNLYNGGFGGNACATEVDGVLTMTKTAGDRWSNRWYTTFPMTECSIAATPIANSLSSGEVLVAEILYDNDAIYYAGILGASGAKAECRISARDDGAKINRITLFFHSSVAAGASVKLKDIMILPTATPTDTTYSPYHKHTFAIPEAVQALDGYGWGIPNGAHNGVELDEDGKPVFVKRVAKEVFKGTESWVISDTATEGKWRRFATVPNKIRHIPTSEKSPAICNHYDTNSPGNNWYCKESIATADDGVYVYDEEYNTKDVSLWKAHLAELYQKGDPLTVYYELAEPIVTDISHLITEDNLIPVEGGGVIVAVNENEEAAPTTIIYPLRA